MIRRRLIRIAHSEVNYVFPTGTRLLLTLMYELERRGGGTGVASACIGGGQGIAMIIESVR